MAKFDGVSWTVYNTSNSGLPNNSINALVSDAQGNTWIGTSGGGLAKFDGVSWMVYSTGNSGLPSNSIQTLAIDAEGNKWIGTFGGLAKFDGANWTVYNTSNSGMPDNAVNCFCQDAQGSNGLEPARVAWRSLTARAGRSITRATPGYRATLSGLLLLRSRG